MAPLFLECQVSILETVLLCRPLVHHFVLKEGLVSIQDIVFPIWQEWNSQPNTRAVRANPKSSELIFFFAETVSSFFPLPSVNNFIEKRIFQFFSLFYFLDEVGKRKVVIKAVRFKWWWSIDTFIFRIFSGDWFSILKCAQYNHTFDREIAKGNHSCIKEIFVKIAVQLFF